MLLDQLTSPADIATLPIEELDILAAELRDVIIDRVSQNGGHLASNLGTIELTLALLRTYDFTRDRVIWDVGHQAYAYKILTGRRDAFATLRKKNGMSGFPKREESSFDSFNTGHSTTSLSAALGMARGMRMNHQPGKVIAIIGDGAFTGGMAYEALNNIRPEDTNLIVILNDNQMSISSNVGTMARHFDQIRVRPTYLRMKSKTASRLEHIPVIGRGILHFLEAVKKRMRRFIYPRNIVFETFGLRYYGPVDGHDIELLSTYLEMASYRSAPLIIHVVTQKGRGYLPAENRPSDYHGVAPFVIEKGVSPKTTPYRERIETSLSSCRSFSDAFSLCLLEQARLNKQVVAITAAMASGTGLIPFSANYPERFYDVGIAEQHAVTMAAGMAVEGKVPVVAIYSTFMQRALDQVLHDVVYQKLHVVFCIDRAGVIGEDGETHQGLYDRAFLMALPGVTILEPRDYTAMRQMLHYAVNLCEGPVFIRYPRGGTICPETYRTGVQRDGELLPLPGAEVVRVGCDVTLVTSGNCVGHGIVAAELLAQEGIEVEVIDCRNVKPLDIKTIVASVRRTQTCLVVEEVVAAGGIGRALAAHFMQKRMAVFYRHLSISDHPVSQATVKETWADEGIDATACTEALRKLYFEKQHSFSTTEACVPNSVRSSGGNNSLSYVHMQVQEQQKKHNQSPNRLHRQAQISVDPVTLLPSTGNRTVRPNKNDRERGGLI
ncbi:MAG TPA: 1-deoxy-D-xylulose-5-phosphate synthase [Clostridiaceae bacterium]|nr:1-deoxy-D-xylulose-5-phosphate synthase [Clostridiaceae bacterium]